MAIVTPTDITGQTSKTSAVETIKQQDTSSGASTATTPEATTESPEALSPKFAALARQQKLVRQQQRQFEEQRKAFEAEKQKYLAESEKAKSWQSRLTQDPYGVLLEAGLTSDQVAAVMLNQPNPEDQRLQKLQLEIQALKDSQTQTLTKFEQQQKQQYEQAKTQIRTEVTSLVDANEAFETIKAMNAQEAVVELIEHTYNNDGRLMSVDEAAKEVEEYLAEEAWKLANLKKVKSKLMPPAAEQPLPAEQKQVPSQKPLLNTLSNRALEEQAKPLTEKQRRERAILAFQGKL